MEERAIHRRETEGPSCPTCGYGGGSWEESISLLEALLVIFEDPAQLGPLFSRACHGCGRGYEWPVVVMAGDGIDPADEPAVQERLVAAIRSLLSERMITPELAAERLRRRFGVEAIYVERGSEMAWRARRGR